MSPLRHRLMMIALLVAGLLAGWVASAGAGLPSLPPVPTLPQVPTLPVLPPPPQAPQPPAAPLPKVPPVPPVERPALPVGGGGDTASTSPNGSRGGASQRGSTRRPGSNPARVYRLHFSRNWISRAGPAKRRQTTLVFVLRRATIVEFVVVQVAPNCQGIGRFRVVGRPGVNRVRFRGRIGRRVLGPGTYRIRARAVPRGGALVDTKLVVVARPDREVIAAARSADTCRSGTHGQAASASAAIPVKPSAATAPVASGKVEKRAPRPREHGVLGSRFTKTAVGAVKSIPLWVYVLLGLAIALLAVAALPLRATPSRRAALVLAHHRGTVGLFGAAVLLAVTAYALMT